MNKIFYNLIKSAILIAVLPIVVHATPIDVTTNDDITFDWSGICFDCNSAIGEFGEPVTVFGSMVLNDYTFGDDLVDGNIVSFTYGGPSIHIDAFQINNLNQGLDDIYNVTGRIYEDLSFEIEFEFDHIFTYYHPLDVNHLQPFQNQYNVFVDYNLNGEWEFSVVGPGFPEQGPSDFGSGATLSATDVPEPSTLAIFALGMMGLASRKFKKKA